MGSFQKIPLKPIKVSESFPLIRNSIDCSKFETQRTNFEFWDQLNP